MKTIWKKLFTLSDYTESDLIEQCQILPFCKDMANHELQFFLRVAVPRSYQHDETIFKAGSPAMVCYFVLSGSVGLYRSRDKTTMERIKYVKPGECFGEEALFNDELRSNTARAQEETKVLAITNSDFDLLKPIIANKILLFVAQLLHSQLCAAEEDMCALTRRLTEANIIV